MKNHFQIFLVLLSLSTASSFPCPVARKPNCAGRRARDADLASLGAVRQQFVSNFFDQMEETVERVMNKYENTSNILDLPPSERESLGVASNIDTRMAAFKRNKDCPRCWLQQAHCVCKKCPPIQEPSLPSNVSRLFLLMHHKEICLAVDTAKMILAAFPGQCRLVVGGIGPEYQDSMRELLETMHDKRTLVLFPDEKARTFEELDLGAQGQAADPTDEKWDVIIIDGTWAQARKLYSRYITPEEEEGPARVQLSQKAVQELGLSRIVPDVLESHEVEVSGHQLRRHPIKWREVSTLEATRLLLGDMAVMHTEKISDEFHPWDDLARYQQIANVAARRQLGPPRKRK